MPPGTVHTLEHFVECPVSPARIQAHLPVFPLRQCLRDVHGMSLVLGRLHRIVHAGLLCRLLQFRHKILPGVRLARDGIDNENMFHIRAPSFFPLSYRIAALCTSTKKGGCRNVRQPP